MLKVKVAPYVNWCGTVRYFILYKERHILDWLTPWRYIQEADHGNDGKPRYIKKALADFKSAVKIAEKLHTIEDVNNLMKIEEAAYGCYERSYKASKNLLTWKNF